VILYSDKFSWNHSEPIINFIPNLSKIVTGQKQMIWILLWAATSWVKKNLFGWRTLCLIKLLVVGRQFRNRPKAKMLTFRGTSLCQIIVLWSMFEGWSLDVKKLYTLVTLYFEEAWSCQIHLSFVLVCKTIGNKSAQHSLSSSSSQANNLLRHFQSSPPSPVLTKTCLPQ